MPIFSGLEGKRVLITGTSSGIGRSMSYLFSKSEAIFELHFNENKIDKIFMTLKKYHIKKNYFL